MILTEEPAIVGTEVHDFDGDVWTLTTLPDGLTAAWACRDWDLDPIGWIELVRDFGPVYPAEAPPEGLPTTAGETFRARVNFGGGLEVHTGTVMVTVNRDGKVGYVIDDGIWFLPEHVAPGRISVTVLSSEDGASS
jgi:hypothetical protein